MDDQLIFNFKTDISRIEIPEKLNNPFGLNIPEIGRIAAKDFQDYIALASSGWTYDFEIQKGKMFGVLVVQKEDDSLAYLGTVSGILPGQKTSDKFIPPIFDNATDDFFINKGMTKLTEIGKQINISNNQEEIIELIESRKLKSVALQQRLFENTHFLNLLGAEKNVLQIFESSTYGNPAAAAGECAAPKLLQYALKHSMRPIAVAEFWWGKPPKNKEREHKGFYPACKNKCRPILEFMLNDSELFKKANLNYEQL